MIQGQKEGISVNEIVTGKRKESGFIVQAGSYAPKIVCPQVEQSLLNVCEERVSVKPNPTTQKKNSPIREAEIAKV